MSAPAPAVVWHDVECGPYGADLPLWRELAAAAGGPVLDVGAGTGRVTLDLARQGHEVTALDRDPDLLAALRGRTDGVDVETVVADARDFDLGRRFALCLVPMQTVQILGGPHGRAAFLRCAHAHLEPGGVLACALADTREGFGDSLPLPDMREIRGWLWSSQPVEMRRDAKGTVIRRLRERVSPTGERTVEHDAVHLDDVTAEGLAAEGRAAGFDALEPRTIPATDEHVGSSVAVLRRPG